MGWLFPHNAYTKEILVEDILSRNNKSFNEGAISLKVLKHSLKGNNLWLVIERNGKATVNFGSRIVFIMLYKLAYSRSNGVWGYKDMDASMHPYENDCPIKFLDMVTEDCKTSHYPDFEKMIREVAAKKNAENATKRKVNLEYGDQVFFNKDMKYSGATGIWSIKVSYQAKRVIAGYGYGYDDGTDADGKDFRALGLLRLPHISNWRKVVKANGDVIEMSKKIEA